MKILLLISFIALSSIFNGFAFSQSPGGVSPSNLTSWFKSSDQLFVDAFMTIPVTNGSNVLAWGNIVTNAQLPSLTKLGGGTITYASTDDYFNYNPVVQIANSAFSRGVSGYNDIFSNANGTGYYNVLAKGGPDLAFTLTSNGTSFPCGGNRCCTGFRGSGSQVTNVGATYGNGIDNTKAHILGATSDYSTLNQNNVTGVLGANNPGTFSSISGGYSYSIFNFPGYNGTGRVSENFTFNKMLSVNETNRIESYLAIKYGVTLGVNGTSKDYLNSTSTVVWTQSANSVYAFDIAGISRDDNSSLDQRKSHSVNNAALVFDDIVVVANGTSFNSPLTLSADRSSFIWGHNGQPTQHNGFLTLGIPTDNGEIIETIFQREWKSQETGTVGVVSMEFDLSLVPGVGTPGVPGANDLANLRLLVDEDGDFTTGATSIAPTSFNNTTNIVYFQHDFLPSTGANLTPFRGFFFTLGSVNAVTTPLPIILSKFDIENVDCDVEIKWETMSEQNSKEFIVERSDNLTDWIEVCRVNAAGNSNSLVAYACSDKISSENGKFYYRLNQIDSDGVSTVYDMRSIHQNCETFKPYIYPNPIQREAFIESPFRGSATVADMNGKVVHTTDLVKGTNTLNLEAISSGVYFVSILLEDNSTEILRFIKD